MTPTKSQEEAYAERLASGLCTHNHHQTIPCPRPRQTGRVMCEFHTTDKRDRERRRRNLATAVPILYQKEVLSDEDKARLEERRAHKKEVAGFGNRQHDRRDGDVYAVSNPAFPGWFKYGSSIYAEDRDYQTGDPHRAYVTDGSSHSPERKLSEKAVHATLASLNFKRGAPTKKGPSEWFQTWNPRLDIIRQQCEHDTLLFTEEEPDAVNDTKEIIRSRDASDVTANVNGKTKPNDQQSSNGIGSGTDYDNW
jgi:hypothetical protein